MNILRVSYGSSRSLEDSANLPDIVAAEIVEDLQAVLAQFAEVAYDHDKRIG
jgi:hypothetical protein